MDAGLKKQGKIKVHCHLEMICKTAPHLVTKLRLFPKHVNISLQTAEVIGSTFPFPWGQPRESKLVAITGLQTDRKCFALATALLNR